MKTGSKENKNDEGGGARGGGAKRGTTFVIILTEKWRQKYYSSGDSQAVNARPFTRVGIFILVTPR